MSDGTGLSRGAARAAYHWWGGPGRLRFAPPPETWDIWGRWRHARRRTYLLDAAYDAALQAQLGAPWMHGDLATNEYRGRLAHVAVLAQIQVRDLVGRLPLEGTRGVAP